MVLATKTLIKLAVTAWYFFLVNRENFKILAYWYYCWCKRGQKEIVKYMKLKNLY
jgi:hypothetical protein